MIGLALALTLVLGQSAPSENKLPLIYHQQLELITEAEALKERETLLAKPVRSDDEEDRFVALTITLGTIPNRCTAEQERALLCIMCASCSSLTSPQAPVSSED